MNVQSHLLTEYTGADLGPYTAVSVVGEYTPDGVTIPTEVTYAGVVSRVHYGSQSPSIAPLGSPASLVSIVNIRNCGDEVCEHFLLGAYMSYSTNTAEADSPATGRAFGTDCIMSGPIKKQQSCFSGEHWMINNFYEGPPLDAPSGAYWALTFGGFAPGVDGPGIKTKAILSYPIGVGFGAIGFTSGPTSVSFMTGFQAGGGGSNWQPFRSHLSMGVDVSDCDAFGLFVRRKYTGLTNVRVTSGGSYTSVPTVSFNSSPPNLPLAGAVGTAVLQPTKVSTTVTMTSMGSGYSSTNPPAVTFDDPEITDVAGVRAEGQANVTGGQVTSITVTEQGDGYTTVPNIAIAPPPSGGTQATATAALVATPVTGIAIDSPGLGYTVAPTISFTPSGASGQASIQGDGVQAIIVDDPGSGYTASNPPATQATPPTPAITLSGGGGGSGMEAVALVTGGEITAIMIKNPGSGYTSSPTVDIDTPTNIQASGSARVSSNGSVTGINITNGGGYYITAPNIAIAPPSSGTTAMAQAEIFGGRVIRVSITNEGSGYSQMSPPSVTFSMGSFAPIRKATARATLGGIAIAVDSGAGPVVFGDITPLGAKLSVLTNDPSTKGMVIRAAGSQSANLQEVQDSAGSALFSIGKAGALTGSMDSMIFASPLTVDVTKGTLHKVTATSNSTFNASSAGNAGQEMTLLIRSDPNGGWIITFGTNFKTTGTLTGTASKFATIRFISDGIQWYEVARTLNL